MPCRRKGVETTYAVYAAVFALVTIAVYFMVGTEIGSGGANKATKAMENLKLMALTKETCVDLDNWGDDRKSGATDVYSAPSTPALASVPVGDANVYALYLKPGLGGVPFTGSWNIQAWNVTCNGLKGTSPFTYTLVKWDYSLIYPKGYLPIEYKSLRTRALIDATETAYKPEWKCTSGITVNLVTSPYEWFGGTDENVELCYYTKRKIL